MYFGEDAFDFELPFAAKLDIDFVNGPPDRHVGNVRNPFHFHVLTEYCTTKSFVDDGA